MGLSGAVISFCTLAISWQNTGLLEDTDPARMSEWPPKYLVLDNMKHQIRTSDMNVDRNTIATHNIAHLPPLEVLGAVDEVARSTLNEASRETVAVVPALRRREETGRKM